MAAVGRDLNGAILDGVSAEDIQIAEDVLARLKLNLKQLLGA
jgi:hypothetical protein